MSKSHKILRLLLFGGAIYFIFVSIAHMIGAKIPFLFIYYNVPSFEYQDKIISFLSFGWAMFLFSGAVNIKTNMSVSMKYIFSAAMGAIIALCFINFSIDFSRPSPNINVFNFWIETMVLSAYLFLVIMFYLKARRSDRESNDKWHE